MVTYKCPKCGSKVTVEYILTNPPITCYRCSSCDYHNDVRSGIDNIVKVAPLKEE